MHGFRSRPTSRSMSVGFRGLPLAGRTASGLQQREKLVAHELGLAQDRLERATRQVAIPWTGTTTVYAGSTPLSS
jgi:hypothetical protein